MAKDDLEKQIEERIARDPGFADLLKEAQIKRKCEYIGYFLALAAQEEENPDNSWLQATYYPFMAAFESEDIAEFAKELEAIKKRLSEGKASLRDYDRLIDDWNCSAEALGDPERMQALSAGVNPDDFAELDRPSA